VTTHLDVPHRAFAVEAVDVTRIYRGDGVDVHALRGVTLRVRAGEYVAVVGPSGSGKSTLMHLLGCLDRPTAGRLLMGGRDTAALSDGQLAELRNRTVGFVFQSFQLLSRTSAIDNVSMPLVYRGVGRAQRRRRAEAALDAVGLGHRLTHRPSQLSGGEQQRVAIARALVGEPSILLADEPTGNLDTRNGAEVMRILDRLNAERAVAVILVTHEPDIAAHARRIISVRDGLIERDEVNTSPVRPRRVDSDGVEPAVPEGGAS
jgi:putative ABC transport system ATP-binding protein